MTRRRGHATHDGIYAVTAGGRQDRKGQRAYVAPAGMSSAAGTAPGRVPWCGNPHRQKADFQYAKLFVRPLRRLCEADFYQPGERKNPQPFPL